MKFRILVLLGILWLSPPSAQGRECVGDEWKCPEDQCIARSFVCDGDADCLDTEGDEDPELCEAWEVEEEEDSGDCADSWWGCPTDDDDTDDDDTDDVVASDDDDYDNDYPEITIKQDEVDDINPWSNTSLTDDVEIKFPEIEPIVYENPERCALKKCKGGGKLMFPSGKYYMYHYVTKAVTEVQGASQQNSSIEIEADVQIQVLTACEMLMKIKDIKVQTSTSDGYGQVIEDQAFADAVKKNYLRFTYEDGVVSWLCPQPDEDPRALNFKRAIIGLLQNTMTRLDLDHTTVETDIVGTCDVHYSVAGAEESKLLIRKTRDMKSCTQRYQGTSAIRGVPYVFIGGVHSLPVLDSHSSCIQEIERHRVVGATCTETHKFVPFSTDKGGLVSTITQRLERTTFLSMESIRMGEIHGRTDLLYDHHNHIHLEETDDDNIKSNEDMQAWKDQVTSILDDIRQSKESGKGMSHEAPRMFYNLILALRHLSFQHILDLTKERTWGPERPVFDDALPMVGTGASVGVMGELMIKGQVNDLIANSWLNSLAFMPRPDLDAISAAAPLLEGNEDIHADAFLGVSALVNSYCRDHSDCSKHPPVERIMKSLRKFVASGCVEEDKFNVVMALKGIGNAGLAVIEGMSEELTTCFRNHEAENEIRVAAINAFRRFPCNVSRLPLQEMFLDTVEDSELRIAAYLGMMTCADYETFKMVQAVLLYEEVNQVGTFVYTHLKNMKKSGLPSRAEVQGFLSNQEIKSKFTSDVTKFSRNFEWSAFYDQLNIGAGIDSNIVFSQESYIPRSVTFNLTTDLFGHSLNLLEVGARVEGLTHYLEKMLGVAPQDDPKPMKNDKLNALIKKVSRGNSYTNKDAEVSLNMKTFGNEVYFRHYHGMEKIMEAVNKRNPLQLITKLNTGETLNIQKSFLPVESTIILPTTAGLPLNLSLTATVALDVHASGSINLFELFRRGNAEITGRIKPSVGVEVVGSMMVDGHAAQSGAQLVSSLHSSTVVDTRLGMRGSELFLVDINMPRDKMEILNFKSNVMLVHGSNLNNGNDLTLEPLEGVLADRMDVDACSGFREEIGSELCWSVHYPNATRFPDSPHFPLTGPAELKVALHKTDPSLTSYQFRYKWERREDYRTFLISLNTPGTTVDREHSIKYNVNFRDTNVRLTFHSPKKIIESTGRYVRTNDEFRVDLSLLIDRLQNAAMSAGWTWHKKASKQLITPIFSIVWQDKDLIKITGDIEVHHKSNNGVLFEVDLGFEYPLLGGPRGPTLAQGSITGTFTGTRSSSHINLDVSYRSSLREPAHQMKLEYQVTNSSTSTDLKYEYRWRFFFSQFPNINFKGEWHYRHHYGTVENILQLNFGKNFENPEHRVDIFQGYTLYLSPDSRNTINITSAIKHPKTNLDLKAGIDLFMDSRVINTGFHVQYATGKVLESRLHLTKVLSGFLKGSGEWTFNIPEVTKMNIKGNITETKRREYKYELDAQISENNWIEVSGMYRDQSTHLETRHNLQLDLRLPYYGLTRTNSTFHADHRQMTLVGWMMTDSGLKYRMRGTYIGTFDDMDARHHAVQLELHLPNQIFSANTELSIGNKITVTTDLHLDSMRDIYLSVIADILQESRRGLQIQLKWDANRDPNQKLDVKTAYENKGLIGSSLEVETELGFLGHKYKARWDSIKERTEIDKDTVWEQRHEGVFSWEDPMQVKQKMTGGMNFRLRRGDKAEMSGRIGFTTPFEDWKNNFIEQKYVRDADHIDTFIKARWHHDEYLNIQVVLQKQIDTEVFRIESTVDVSSSFEGLNGASTGFKLQKLTGVANTNIYIQWDTDRLEITLEGKDESDDVRSHYIVSGNVLTTMEGYRHMSSSVDFLLSGTSLSSHAVAKWDSDVYKLILSGDVYSGNDYLKGDISISTPYNEAEQVITHIRIYHNPLEQEEKLLVTVGWGGEHVVVEGTAATQPEHFKVGVTIKTPFEDFKNIDIALGYTRGTDFKTELKVKWNNIVNSGLVLKGHTTSLSDFIISATVLTPIKNYDEIIFEIRNLFRIKPEVRVHSRVYGQYGDNKIGIGVRYETGDENPRLRTSMELYTPLDNLHTVYFDILDNSSANHFIYDSLVLYGPTKKFRLKLDLEHKEDYADFVSIADLPFAHLSDRLDDTHLEAAGRVSWNPEASVQMDFISNNTVETKASILARFPSPYDGLFKVDLATPFEGYETAKVVINYDVRSDEDREDQLGFLIFELNSPASGDYHGIIQGKDGYYRGNYTTAFSPFRKGEFEYELVARDILKSHANMRLAWDEGEISINSVVEFEDNFIKVLDGTLTTPWVGLQKTQIHLIGEAQGGNYKNVIELTGSEGKYFGNLLWTQKHEKDWELDVTINKDYEGQDQFYQLRLRWRDQPSLSRKFGIEIKTPHNGFKHILLNFELQKNTVPYNVKLEWITLTLGEGDINFSIQEVSFSDLDLSIEMNLHKNTNRLSEYILIFQLINAFKRDWIDFSWNIDLTSNRNQWDHMVLNGTIRQVTLEKPGELRLHMEWPETKPLTFRLYAYHENDFKIIRPSIELDFTASEYKFSGEMIKEDNKLNLNGIVEWRLQENQKKQIKFISNLLMKDGTIDGEATLHLPLPANNPWKTNKASLNSLQKDGRNHFTVVINSGKHTTKITGNVVSPDFPTAEGEIAITSTMSSYKLPIILKFKQELTLEQYHGEYNLQYPVLYKKKWIHRPINASLLHKYLPSGHSGNLQLSGDFTRNIPFTITYKFQFPSTGDMIIKFGIIYHILDLNIKAERVTVIFQDGVEKRRFSLEIGNPLWPFGFSSTKETKRKSVSEYDKKTTLSLYDLTNTERAISVILNRNRDESGRLFTVEAQLPTRVITFSTGYVFTHDQIGGSFLIGWAKDEKIEVVLDWKDISEGFMKEHVLSGSIAHPFRTVKLDGYYKRSSKNIDAKLNFNWDAEDESTSDEVVTGELQCSDESNIEGEKQYKLFIGFGHPKLEKDISLRGEFRQTAEELLGGSLYLQYSPDILKDLNMAMTIRRDLSILGSRHFVSDLSIFHPSSSLTVACNGSLQVGGGIYGFKQQFLYVTENGIHRTAKVDALVDTINKKMHALLEGSKKVVDIHVTIIQEAGDRWRLEAIGRPGQKHPFTSKLELHPKHPVFTLTIDNIASWTNDTDFDFLLSEPRFLADRAVIQGGVEDLRNAKFIMKHQVPAWLLKKIRGISDDDDIEETESEELVWVNDADFYLRLNHSRLLTSKLAWRTNIKDEFMNEVGELIGMSYDLRTDLQQWAIKAVKVAAKEAGKRAQPIIVDLASVARPLLVDFRNESKAFMEDLVLLYESINSTAQELKMKETLTFVAEKIGATLSEISFIKRLRERGGGGGGVQLKMVIQKLKSLYIYTFSKDPSVPGIKERLKSLLAEFASVYDQFAKRFYLKAALVVQDFTSRVRTWLRSKWHAVFQNYKPHILVTFNMVETQTWQFFNRMMNTLKGIGFEIKASSYYKKIVQLVSYFENIYDEITNNSIRQNLEKYYTLFWEKISVGAQVSIDRVAPFVRDWTNELIAMWQKILLIPTIATMRRNYLAINNRVVWAWKYLDVYGQTMDAAAFLLEHGYTIVSQTGVDAKQRHLKAKTDFRFNPEVGIISLVQKLPVDWNSFNDQPNWEDLPEYKVVRKIKGLFAKSNSTSTYLDFWYKYVHGHVLPSNWIPPFEATGYMIGEQHFITFDGRAIEFKGICQYILAADIVHEFWAVTVKYHSNSQKTIKIYVDGKEIEIELDYRVKVDGKSIELPINLKTSSLTRTLSRVELATDTGLSFSWNMEHDVIAISVTGYYFYKTGGLLGVYNNEPSDDYQVPGGDSHGYGALADSADNLATSWSVSQECQFSGNIARAPSKDPIATCNELFISRNSPLKHCFYTIEPEPYLHMCYVGTRSAKDACQVATAYTEACMKRGIPIKIPVFCTQCTYMTNSGSVKKLEEGKSVMLSHSDVLQSTDVVILLEARSCNKDFSIEKKLHKFIYIVNDELSKNGFPKARFAVIAYGGRGAFKEPTFVTVNNQIFTQPSNLYRAIDHIEFTEEVGGRPADAFGAMTFAAGNTDFRPSVSVTFLHFPCSACDPRYMMVSYSDMYHILLETSVTLHVFTPGHFNIAKKKVRNKLFGMDRETAYTIKDARGRGPLRGDPVLRRQLNAPKDDLGYCAALAIETNGTIFTAEHMKSNKKRQMKSNKKKQVEKMAMVVGRVVANKAVPQENQHCECLSTLDGAPIMKCINWDFGPLSIIGDFGYDPDMDEPFDNNYNENGLCEERNEEGVCLLFRDV